MPSPPIDAAALLTALIATSDDAIVSKDLQGTVTSWNAAAEQLFGYTADEMVGRSIRTIIPADRQSEEDEVLGRIRKGGAVRHFETVRRRKDGSLVPISLTVSPIRDANGVLVGASKIARDISDRLRAEAELVQLHAAQDDLQRRLLALVAASGSLLDSPRIDDVLAAVFRLAEQLIPADGYAVWRVDTVSGAWGIRGRSGISDTFASQLISSSSQGDPNGATRVPFSEPLIAEDVRDVAMLSERREVYEREGIRSILAIPLTISGEPSGTLVFYYRVCHRFTEVEIQTARALGNLASSAISTAELYDDQDRNQRRAEFLAQAGTALASSLDYQATLKAVAKLAVPHIADYSAVDLVGDAGRIDRLVFAHVDPAKLEFARRFQETYPEDPHSPYGVAHVIRTGIATLMETVPDEMIVAVARDAEHAQAARTLGIRSFMCVPMLAHGRTLGAITFAAAESGRHYSFSDLRFAEDLASRAALAVENARAYGEARQANRLKDDFLATLSHELRTPLNAILGYARMLRTGVLTGEKQTRGLEIVERSAASLTQIVEDVLDVSRIISGKIHLNVQPLDLSDIVTDAVATILPAAEAKGIQVRTTIEPMAGRVSGDGDRIRQIIWNLLSNAVKFTPRDGRVQVQVEAIAGHVDVVVSDTGIGFPPEFAAHMFERFRQADSSFTREHGGLGLGLAIARHLVEMHGGTIHADSEGKGRGATFRMRLPATGSGRDDAARPVQPRGEFDAGVALKGLDGIHVVAVDDDQDALTLVREILEAAGARVSAFDSPRAVLNDIAGLHPDVLIADLGMPVIDGFELITRVRALADADVRGVPAAAVTAYARSEDRTKALRHGYQMHLAKPIDPAELVAAVAALARPRARAHQTS